MSKSNRNDTLYIIPKLATSLIKELGLERFEKLSGRKSQQIYLWRRIGFPVIYGKYLLLKFPHLLTWADYGITCEEDLEQYQDYVSTFRAQAKERTEQKKAARAKQ